MKINERREELKEETNENIQSEEGILKRQTRSIQTEGHFGDIKENENFRRFHYRSKEKVYKEFMPVSYTHLATACVCQSVEVRECAGRHCLTELARGVVQ